ncbi:PGC-1 and ERR-induced regulator in muscle protein 1 [Rhinophrynus dorsalis]
MDNFEYSIQINDRDWAEFYETAEECGLMPVSLATEEELLLSDPEHEDVPYRTGSSRPKVIRVSLCPPQEENPAKQKASEPAAPVEHARYCRIVSDEDVLSGSEDEGDFGSVVRFLCQRDTRVHRGKVAEPNGNIPVTKQGGGQCMQYQCIDTSPVDEEDLSLVDQLRTLNKHRTHQYGGEIHSVPAGHTTPRSRLPDDQMERNHSHNGSLPCSVFSSPSRTTEESLHVNSVNDSPDSSLHEIQTHPSVNGASSPDGYIRGSSPEAFTITSETVKGAESYQPPTSGRTSTAQFSHLNTAKEVSELPSSCQTTWGLSEPPKFNYNNTSKHNLHDTKRNNGSSTERDSGLHVISRTMTDPSCLQHNIPDPSVGKQNLYNPGSVSHEADIVDGNRAAAQEPGDYKGSTTGNTAVTLTHPTGVIPEQNLDKKSGQLQSEPCEDTAFTLAEMYDFFYDDTSEMGSTDIKPKTLRGHEEGIMYTPDMYEYFFIETSEEENRNMNKKEEQVKQVSREDLVSVPARQSSSKPPPVVLCHPEAYEFFFPDRTEHQQDSDGVMIRVPASHAQSAATALQSFLPQGLCRVRRGISLRGEPHLRGTEGKLVVQKKREPTDDTCVTTTGGTLAPRTFSGKGEVCLVLLAFASWAAKSSNLQSSDSWKTVLLANLGALSAIRYLRSRTGGGWPGSSEETG